jgi:glycosyltransferase involved in cell wall biosynthesis
MLVYHAMEWESLIEGGVKVSARQQRKALDRAGVAYATERPGDYDVLHLNFPGPVSLANLLRAKAAGKKVVIHCHSVGENIAGTYRLSGVLAPAIQRYFARVYASADRVIAVSEYTRGRLAAHGVDENVTVVSNGVDDEALDGWEGRTYSDAPADTSDPVVVNLAQVYEIKGVSDFVTVGERLPDTDFFWFGPKHDYLTPKSTKRTVASAPDNVRFPGFVKDKRDALGFGDVFLFPTHRDNQPLSILEAAYTGQAIVTRDIPAFEGWLEDGVHCLKADSVDGFVECVERLRDDPDLRAELGRNARAMAAEHTLDAVGAELRAVYESVLAE